MATAAHALGLASAVGVLLAGVLLAATECRHQIEVDPEPFEDLLRVPLVRAFGLRWRRAGRAGMEDR